MQNNNLLLRQIILRRPQAVAEIKGDARHAGIRGRTEFYRTPRGVIVYTEVWGLPFSAGACSGRIFAFHIHDGFFCAGRALNPPFPNSGSHYNPQDCDHPFHAGDLPPLFGNRGYAMSVFLTDRITINEIIGKTIIIHSGADDFTTQPAGSSGDKIACGEIRHFV